MRRRLIPVTAISVLLLAGVTGCSAQASSDDCSSPIQPGSLTNNVSVLGEFGVAPQVSIPKDVSIQMPQRTVLMSSEDRSNAAVDNSLVSVNLAYFDSMTGEPVGQATPFDPERGSSFVIIADGSESPVSESLRCSAPGDRTVVALAPMESLAFTDQLGLTAGASLVMVLDTVSVSPLSVDGAVQGLPSGFPAVVTDETGQPGIVLPPRDAPSGTQTAARIVGDGPVVEADDTVVVQALVVGWDGESLVNTRANGNPVPLQGEAQAGESGVTFRSEITGHTVGSQIVIIEGGENAQVVVLDILANG